MGVVHQATDEETGRQVAVKLILPDAAEDPIFRRRFEREARLSASVQHPNLLPVLASGEADGQLFLVTPVIDGVDLEAVLATRGSLNPVHAAAVAAQVGSALAAAAARGLVHRDVKPGNVLLERGSAVHAYLMDFGLTKQADSRSGLTGTGQWVGTLDYAAPEQFGGGAVGPQTDVYALGCLLYESLTGSIPFERDRDVAKMAAHLAEPAPRPSASAAGVPEALDRVVERAMAKAPEDRFPDGGELGAAALDAVRGMPSPAEPLVPEGARADAASVDRGAPTVG